MKKIVYLTAKNVRSEITVYEPLDYLSARVTTNSAYRPVLTNADGFVDDSFLKPTAASLLQLTRTADSQIDVGDCVYSVNETKVAAASYNSTMGKALVLGVALNAGNAGDLVQVVVLGVVRAPVFSVFTVNQPLYLDVDGAITDERPSDGHLVPIGKALGNSQIMVQPGYPTIVGK